MRPGSKRELGRISFFYFLLFIAEPFRMASGFTMCASRADRPSRSSLSRLARASTVCPGRRTGTCWPEAANQASSTCGISAARARRAPPSKNKKKAQYRYHVRASISVQRLKLPVFSRWLIGAHGSLVCCSRVRAIRDRRSVFKVPFFADL